MNTEHPAVIWIWNYCGLPPQEVLMMERVHLSDGCCMIPRPYLRTRWSSWKWPAKEGEKSMLTWHLLTDGLRAEREQGITIDVAYRYFATPKRKFIIADTPGHVQYTRNMVTGASTANLAIILVDARHGVLEQTIRHAFIASLLGIPHILICVNKMDLVEYSEDVFEDIKKQFDPFKETLNIADVRFIPISALKGDNVVDRSDSMNWYEGPTLLEMLETIDIRSDADLKNRRFPVQYVIRPQREEFHDYRGYAGRIAGGVWKPGEKVAVLPSWYRNHTGSH